MGVTSFQLINFVGVLAAVSVLSQDMRGQSALFNSRTRPSASQQMTLLRQQSLNQPASRSREFPMNNLARQPNRQLGGNPQLRQSGSSFRDISRPRLQQANNANQAQRSMRVQPQQTFRQISLQQELQRRKQQQERLQQQRLQMENGVGSVSTRRNLPRGQQFSSFQRTNRISGQTQGRGQGPLPVSGLNGSRRSGVDISRAPTRPGGLPQDQFLRLAVLNNRSPEDIRKLARSPEEVTELEEQQRQLYYLRLREERLLRQVNQRLQETRPRRPQMKLDQGTQENLRQQILNRSQQQQKQQRLISVLNSANLQKLNEKKEKDSLLAKREKIYNLIKLLGIQPTDLFNIVAALQAGISYQAPKEQPRKDLFISDPSYPPKTSQPPPMTSPPNYVTSESTLMTNEPVHVTNEPYHGTSQPARVTTPVMHLTNEPTLMANQSTLVTTPLTNSTSEPTRDLVHGTHNLTNTTQSPTYVVSNTSLFTDEPVYWTNDLQYVTDGSARLTSLPQIVTTISDQMTSQPPIVTKPSDQIFNQSPVMTIPAEQVTSQPQIVTIPSDQGASQLQNVTIPSDQGTNQPQIVTIPSDRVTTQPPIVTIAPDQMTSQTPVVTMTTDQVTLEPKPYTSQLPNVTKEPSQSLNESNTASHKPAAMTNESTSLQAPRNRYDVSIVLGMSPVDTTTVSVNNIAVVEYFDPSNGSFPDVSFPQTTNRTMLTNLTTDPANSNTESFPSAGDWTRTDGAIAPGSMMDTQRDWSNGSATLDMRTGQNDFRPNDVQNVQTPSAGLQQMTTDGGPPNDDLFTASKMLLAELIGLSESTSNTNAVVNDKLLLQNIATIISLLLARNPMYNSNNDTTAIDPTFMSFDTPAYNDVNNSEIFNGVNVGNSYNNEMISGINPPNSYNNDIARDTNLANNYNNEMLGGINPPYNNNGELNGRNFANNQGEMNALNNVHFAESPIPAQTHPFQQTAEMTTSATVANYTEYIHGNFLPENSNRFTVTGGENNNVYSEMSHVDAAAANEKLSMATAIAGMYGIPIDEAMLMLNAPAVRTSGEQAANTTNTLFNNATTSVLAGSDYVPSMYVQTDASPVTTQGNTPAPDTVLLPKTSSYQVYKNEPAPPTWSHLNSRQEEGSGVQNSVMNFTETANDNFTVNEGSDRNVVLVWDSAAARNNLPPSLTDTYNESLSSDNLLETKTHNPYNSGLSTTKDEPLLSQATFPGVNVSTNEDKTLKPQTGNIKPKLDTRSLMTSFTKIAQTIANNVIQPNPGTENSGIFSSATNGSSLNHTVLGMNSSETAATGTVYTPVNDGTLNPAAPGMNSSDTAATGTFYTPVNDSTSNNPAPGMNSSETAATGTVYTRVNDGTLNPPATGMNSSETAATGTVYTRVNDGTLNTPATGMNSSETAATGTVYTPVNDGTLNPPATGMNSSETAATGTFHTTVNDGTLNTPAPGMNSSETAATGTMYTPVKDSTSNTPAPGMNSSDTAATGTSSTLLEDTTTYKGLSKQLVSSTSPMTTVE